MYQEALQQVGLGPVHPVSASFTISSVTLLRYLMDPNRPAYLGSEPL